MNAFRSISIGFAAFVFCLVPTLGPVSVANACPPQESIADLKTVAERSDYKATSKYAEVIDFVDRCCVAEHVTRYDFGQSVEGRAMVAAVIANPPYDMGADNPGGQRVTDIDLDEAPKPKLRGSGERLRILLLGNIHSGECAGKEALLAMLRGLAADPEHPWLRDCVIVIAPNYNVDANERVGLLQRRGQVGPEQGMGQRENAMQLDLNRDFCKLESPEARSLIGLINDFDPHMFIDCHTTNGSRHQYVLTYDIPHNPTCPKQIRDYLRNNMMPKVTKDLEEKGVLAFFYGNFNRDNTQWSTYGHEPRYSTEYVGLRGRLGILSEAYSYATYRERIEGTDAFVRQCVEHIRANSDDVRKLLADVRLQQLGTPESDPADTLIHLNSEMAPFAGKFTIRGFDGEEKKDYEVTFFGDYKPVTSVSMPAAYILPPEMSLQAERLQMHGVEIEQIPGTRAIIMGDHAEITPVTPSNYDVSVYTVTNINRSPRPFQKHNMVTLETSVEKKTVTPPAGSFFIRTGQPLGRLVSYMLEPETNEGLVTWNFLDPWLEIGKPYPILRVEFEPRTAKTQFGLKSKNEEKVTDIKPGGRLKLADIYGPDKIALAEVSLNDVQWLEDGKTYSVEKNGRRVAVHAETGGETRMSLPFEVGDVAAAMRDVDGPDRNEIMRLLNSGIELRGVDQKLFVLVHDGKTFLFDAEKKKGIRLGTDEASAELADLNPTGDKVAFVRGNNLMLLSDIDSDPFAITDDGSESVFNGKLDWVYQEELYGRGNFKAFWWSPDGNSIAWLRTDEAPVNTYTVTDHIPVRGRLEVTAYPKAGDPLPKVTMAVYQLDSKATKWAKLPKQPDEPLNELLISRVSWEPNSESVYVQIQNRIQSWLDLCRVNPASGELSVVFRDQTPAWIKTPGDPVFLDDGSFLWTSPRSGFNSIYRYSAEGTELAKLTNDSWEVRDLLGCDFDKGLVYFTGSPDTPTQVAPMRVKLDGTETTKLVDMPGTFSVNFNKDFSYFLTEHSSATKPDEIMLFNAAGQQVRNVIPNRDDRLRHLAISAPEFFWIPIGEEDNHEKLDAMLIRPSDFDSANKYPVLVHIYGGPQAPRVRDRFGGQTYLWHQYLAQQGFVVFVVDNRSSSFRSAEQVWPIYRDLARREMADIEWAVNWLKQYNGWVADDRIGIWGWSYGGFMTSYALTHSDLFNCGIAGAPVTDWKNYDAVYTERYMDTPQANPDGYADSSVLTAAENLAGKLLLIHGTIDDNVHISNTMQFAQALQKAGQQFELMVYPENRHAVRDPQQRLHLYQLMTDFLIRNLMPYPSD